MQVFLDLSFLNFHQELDEDEKVITFREILKVQYFSV